MMPSSESIYQCPRIRWSLPYLSSHAGPLSSIALQTGTKADSLFWPKVYFVELGASALCDSAESLFPYTLESPSIRGSRGIRSGLPEFSKLIASGKGCLSLMSSNTASIGVFDSTSPKPFRDCSGIV